MDLLNIRQRYSAENEEELDEIDICKKYRQDQEYSMGESEKQLLNILDEIGVKRQAYHRNVFIGNHCKVILVKDKNQVYNFEKLCSVLSDRLEREHFIEVFRLYSEARLLMARKHILLDHEKARLTSLCYKFGELFFVYFPMVALTRKIRELVFDVPRFVGEHGTVGLFSEGEGESLHHEINLESAQLSCVRSDPERLRLALERHEQHSQADRSLFTPPAPPRWNPP